MAVSPVGYSDQTPKRYLLDAGAIYKNMTYDSMTNEFTGTQLGATSGGNELQIEIEMREVEVDGVKGRVKGNKFVNLHQAHLVVNLKEITAENIKNAIGPADVDATDPEFDIVTGRTQIKDGDYLDNIAFVGRHSGTSKPIVIMLDNALSAEGFSMSPEDDNEAIIPITFHAHLDPVDVGTEKVPYQIYWPKEAV